ncbi:MAG: leucine-rich repeat domain-containing protein [Methanobacteriota archaeon]|nr:MAG: leucine-rich repeat domain-containing protein [Euryarchaeota archaeon]
METIDEREILKEALESIGLKDRYSEILEREQTIISPFLELNSIDLSNLELKILPPEFFWRFPHLFAINLSGNQLTSLSSEAFVKNKKLRELFLRNNQISDLPDGLLKNALHLQTLDLSGNELQNLPNTFFQRTVNLRKLNLADNRLKSLPKSFFRLRNLWTLDLSGNALPADLNKVAIDENSVREFIKRIEEILGDH